MRLKFFLLSASIALLLISPLARSAQYNFTGTLNDGPLAGQVFSGSYAFDVSALLPSFTGELPLTDFFMQLGPQGYTLIGADASTTPSAAFDFGSFIGLSFSDSSALDTSTRPQVAFVAGFNAFDQAYVSYVGAAGAAGFGGYSVSPVPEPGTWALWLAGTAVVAALARRRKA